jgi:hypothetical protein
MLKRTAAVIVAVACAVAFAATADAAVKKKRRHIVRSYTQERVAALPPRARITVRKRSYLDGGTEVMPGERKFNDYAQPVGALAISPRDPYRGGDIQWNSSSWPPGTFPGF